MNKKKFFSMLMSWTMTLGVCSMAFAKTITIKENSTLDNILGVILGIIQAIAVAFATGMLLYVGIKYTMASANEKADLKKGSINYVIGAVIIFACSGILTVLRKLGSDIEDAG